MAIASLVVGLVSLAVGFCCGLCGSPLPIVGLILGVVAVTQTDERGLAIAGIVVNGLAIVVIVAMVALNSYFFFGNQAGAGGMQPFQDLIPQPLDATDPPPHDPATAPTLEPVPPIESPEAVPPPTPAPDETTPADESTPPAAP